MIPLPETIASLLGSEGTTNLSLLRDRGATYETYPTPEIEHDSAFLAQFVQRFNAPKTANNREFANLMERRLATLGSHARRLHLKTRSRFVLGLGLPQSGKENTAILLDHLTGCPYIPGSSVKGLARRTAREVAEGSLDGDQQFWQKNQERLFGSQSAPMPGEGDIIFYDAFPENWPKLELDVLTPHYKNYYENANTVPGDWENPVPIQFIVVHGGVWFDFFFRGLNSARRDSDEEKTSALLTTALDWLGIGAKKSSGYGSFQPAAASRPNGENVVRWENAEITWIANTGKLRITRGKESFETGWKELLTEEQKNRVKNSRKPVIADVEVRETGRLREAVRITFR